MKSKSSALLNPPLWLLVLAVGAATGCTHTTKINVSPTQLPAQGKSPARAALVLDSELKDFKYQFGMMGDKFVYLLGPSLEQYARNVVGHAFSAVTVHSTAQEAADKADTVLIPKAIKADQSSGIWAWDDRNLILVVEWTLKDARNQSVLWLKPIEAKATETGGNLFTYKSHERKLFQKLFDDLNVKTFEALMSSPEIMRLNNGAN